MRLLPARSGIGASHGPLRLNCRGYLAGVYLYEVRAVLSSTYGVKCEMGYTTGREVTVVRFFWGAGPCAAIELRPNLKIKKTPVRRTTMVQGRVVYGNY